MPFESTLAPGTPVIDDSNWQQFVNAPPGHEKGLIPTPDLDGQFCAEPFTRPFDIPHIPRSEWADRIEEMERTKTRLSDLGQQYGIKVKNQDGYGYCWAFGTTTTVEYARAVQGLEHVELSATSVAGPIKNYANQGGWGKEALAYIVQHGVCPASMWPEVPTGANRRYDTEENRQERTKFKVTEWYEIRHGDFDAVMTALLLRMPVSVGLSWWGHLVAFVDPIVKGGQFGVKFPNSWAETWGEGGWGVLMESKARNDDVAVVPVVTTVI